MSPTDLADAVTNTVLRLRGRILGPGADQYSQGGTQKFENMPLPVLVREAQAEADDLVNYGVMLGIRLERLAANVEELTARRQQQLQEIELAEAPSLHKVPDHA